MELSALRRLTSAAFGTLMCLEPAIALTVGLVLLGQVPGWAPVVGIGLVIAAGIGAERTGARATLTRLAPGRARLSVEHAELVALRVGEHGEGLLARLPDVRPGGAETEQPLHLAIHVPALGAEVEV